MLTDNEDDFWSNMASYVDEQREAVRAHSVANDDGDEHDTPFDLWAKTRPPEMANGLLPEIIEEFAHTRARMMGCDPGGLAMSALTVCAAAIPDCITIKVKKHDDSWRESARLWTMLIGDPSFKKSPVIRAASGRIAKIDSQMLRDYNAAMAKWKEDEFGDMPVPVRCRMDDTTMEAAQEVCRHSPNGVLALQDELSGWFGGIEKYSGGKGGAKDRSFWLRAYGGGEYAVNRAARGSFIIDNLSVSILGGIQPEPLRDIAGSATDDGLIQRFIPIVLQPSAVGTDEEMPECQAKYDALIERLMSLKQPENFFGPLSLEFSDGAREIRNDLERRHHRMSVAIENVNKKLSAHIGKYDGMFPRLCIIWHCIENVGAEMLPVEISEGTARRCATFLHSFILRHAMAFQTGILGLSDDQAQLEDVAGFILAHGLSNVTMRHLARGSRKMKKITRDEGAQIFEQLEAMGWLEQVNKRSDAPSWNVNPKVHSMYASHAETERVRRKSERETLQEMLKGGDSW